MHKVRNQEPDPLKCLKAASLFQYFEGIISIINNQKTRLTKFGIGLCSLLRLQTSLTVLLSPAMAMGTGSTITGSASGPFAYVDISPWTGL